MIKNLIKKIISIRDYILFKLPETCFKPVFNNLICSLSAVKNCNINDKYCNNLNKYKHIEVQGSCQLK